MADRYNDLLIRKPTFNHHQGTPMDPASEGKRSAFVAGEDRREYNVYVETANVEKAWPAIPEWPLSNQMGPLLVSLEITLKILDDTLDETGNRIYLNDAAKAEVVVRSLCSQLKLVAEIAFESTSRNGHGEWNKSSAHPPEVLFGSPSQESAWRGVMEKLEKVGNGQRLREEIQSQYDLAVNAFGFELGLTSTPGLRGIDYDKWVRPVSVHLLYTPDRRQRYVEDAIFVRVHQVCKGILEAFLVELDKVEAALFKADYPAAEKHVLMASRFLKPFECTINLLGEMSQIDYSPLRVALRDASGIQSARAQARKSVVKDHFWLFQQQLKTRALDCFVVLANHDEHVWEYRLLQAFKVLSRSIQETMSNHAHLVQNTLGSTVIGTAGFRILSLGEIAAYPLLPDLASSLDLLTLWTNLRFADHSGIVIHEQEAKHGVKSKYEVPFPTRPCDPALMIETTAKYFDAIREHKKEDWKELFSDSPHFEDPKGTKPYVSEFNLDVFFRNFQKLFPKICKAESSIVEAGDNFLKVEWAISAESFFRGIEAQFGGTETFYFDPQGKILIAFAEWEPAALAEQLMERYRVSLRNTH